MNKLNHHVIDIPKPKLNLIVEQDDECFVLIDAKCTDIVINTADGSYSISLKFEADEKITISDIAELTNIVELKLDKMELYEKCGKFILSCSITGHKLDTNSLEGEKLAESKNLPNADGT